MVSGAPENSQVTAGRGITCTEIDKAPTTFSSEDNDNCRCHSLNQLFPLGINVTGTGKIWGERGGQKR